MKPRLATEYGWLFAGAALTVGPGNVGHSGARDTLAGCWRRWLASSGHGRGDESSGIALAALYCTEI